MSFGSGTVSLTISHPSEWQILLSGCASLCRNTTMLLGWKATTKSPPSRPIDTCRRGGNRVPPDAVPPSTDIRNPRTTDRRERSVAVAGARPLAARRLIHKRQCAGDQNTTAPVGLFKNVFCRSRDSKAQRIVVTRTITLDLRCPLQVSLFVARQVYVRHPQPARPRHRPQSFAR